MNFQASVNSSSQTQFSIKLQKDGDQGIGFLKFQYLAINLKDSFIKSGFLDFQQSFVTCDSNWMCAKQTFNYQKSNFDSKQWNVTVGFYIIGLQKVQLQFSGQTISILNEIVYYSNSFDVIMKTRDKNVYNKIKKIYYNYIEIYQQIDNGYYHFQNVRDNTINPINPNDPLTQSTGLIRTSNSPAYQINIDAISGIFLGFTGLEVNYFNLRFSFGSPQFNPNPVDSNVYTYQMSYKTYQDTTIIGGQAQIMVFSQVNCQYNNTYFLDDMYQCVSSCPEGYYLAQTPDLFYKSLNQCLACDASCKTCNGPSPQSCLSCSKAYLLNNTCYKIRPNNTYCDESNNCSQCAKTQSDHYTPMCNQCDNTLMNCLECQNPNQYLYKKVCYVDKPIKTYCDSKNICEDCFINCQSCKQTTSKDCLSCIQPFVLDQNQCICPDLSQTYNVQTNQCEFKQSSAISQDTQKSLQSGGNAVNQASVGMSIGFALIQGFTSSGCALLSQILTIQKIFYLELVNISTPNFLLQFIRAISNDGITHKFAALNVFSKYTDLESQSYNSTLDYQFKYNKLTSSLVSNSGGGFFVLIIIFLFQTLFTILGNSQCQSSFFKIYDQIISSLTIQLLQTLILLFFYSSLVYLLDDNQQRGITSYVFLIIYFVYIILALIVQSVALFKLNEKSFNKYEPNIQDILQYQLANGVIVQKTQSRMVFLYFQISSQGDIADKIPPANFDIIYKFSKQKNLKGKKNIKFKLITSMKPQNQVQKGNQTINNIEQPVVQTRSTTYPPSHPQQQQQDLFKTNNQSNMFSNTSTALQSQSSQETKLNVNQNVDLTKNQNAIDLFQSKTNNVEVKQENEQNKQDHKEEHKQEIIQVQNDRKEQEIQEKYLKMCSIHKGYRLQFLSVEQKSKKYLLCPLCISEGNGGSLICLDLIFGSDKLIKNLPKEEEDSEFLKEIQKTLGEEDYCTKLIQKINDYFGNLKSDINKQIEIQQQQMLKKAGELQNYQDKIQSTYDNYIKKEKIKQLLTKDQDINKVEKELQGIINSIYAEKKSFQENILQMIQNYQTQNSAINYDQANHISKSILQQIESIDIFKISDFQSLSQTNYYENLQFYKEELFKKQPNQLSTSQLLVRLISNIMNNCPLQLLEQFQQLIAKIQGFIDTQGIKVSSYDRDILKVNYNNLNSSQFELVQHLSESLLRSNSSSLSSVPSNQSSKNKNTLMKLISNKFNYCSQDFLNYISSELDKIIPFIDRLNLNNITEIGQKQINGQNLNQNCLDQVTQLIEALEQTNIQDQIQKQKIEQFQKVLDNKTNYLSNRFKENFNKVSKQYPDILANMLLNESLFKKCKYPLQDFNSLNDEQMTNLQNLAKKITQLTQDPSCDYLNTNQPIYYQQIQSNYFVNQIKRCLNIKNLEKQQQLEQEQGVKDSNTDEKLNKAYKSLDTISNLLVKYPIFDLQEDLFINRQKLEFQHPFEIELNPLKIQIQKNNTLLVQEKSVIALVITKKNLDPNLNYVFRCKLNKKLDCESICFGIMQAKNTKDKYLWEENLAFRSARSGHGLYKIIKGQNLHSVRDQIDYIEVRVNVNKKIVLFADYPYYNNINQANPEDFSADDQNYKFGIQFYAPGDDYVVEITDINIVEENELQTFQGQNDDEFEDLTPEEEEELNFEGYYLPPIKIYADRIKKEKQGEIIDTSQEQVMPKKAKKSSRRRKIKLIF
ncbi:hypothetical protein ABPG72_020640 [Tetrahymena utriculariae]